MRTARTMHRARALLAALLFVAASAPAAAPAQRIVTLAPHLAELVAAAGAADRLVGVSTYSDHPAALAHLPIVGSGGQINLEAVLALHPDLVLVWQSGNNAAGIAELRRRGLNVVSTDASRLGDVARLIRQFGALAGTSQMAEANARAYERRIAAQRVRYAQRAPVRVFVEIWHAPLMTVNAAHVISEALDTCGAVNVFAEAAPLTPIVSREQLYARQPDAILSTGFIDDAALYAAWRAFAPLDAVRDGRVYRIDADLLARMGPRLADGVAQVCAAVQRAREALGR